jgi:transposase
MARTERTQQRPRARAPDTPLVGPGQAGHRQSLDPLKEVFQKFWPYRSARHARIFLRAWCTLVIRSRLDPMKKVVRTLCRHEGLLLNWFHAKGEILSGAVEGMNNKIQLVTRRSYSFRTDHALVLPFYHNLG